MHANRERVMTAAAKAAFQRDVKKWIQERVARHKFLRGGELSISWLPKSSLNSICVAPGVVVIDIIPKR